MTQWRGSLRSPATTSGDDSCLETLPHAGAVGCAAGEYLECLGRLVDRHPTAVESSAAGGPGRPQQLRLDGKIDDVGDPQIGA